MDPKLADIPDTDEWWAVRLAKKLGDRLPRIHDLQGWMDGEPPIDVKPDQADNDGFGRILKIARLNLAELIVNAVLYRMQPLGFRTAADNDENGDDKARRLWKHNNMAVTADQIIEWMLTFADSYGSVGLRAPGDRSSGIIMRSEHASEMITEDDPLNPGYSLAALKIYRDDLTNSDVAVLWRQGPFGAYYRVLRRQSSSTVLPKDDAKRWSLRIQGWEWDAPEVPDGVAIENARGDLVNPTFTKFPPIQLFRNRQGKGEFEKHLATLIRINHTILQRMIIIAFQAFRQRGVKGVPDKDPKTGEEIDYRDIFKADPGAVWILPATAEFWESGAADMGPVLNAVKDDIIHLAVSSSTPLFSVVPDAANGSAEGAALQREGLIFKTEACIKLADQSFCRMMGQAFEMEGDTQRADVFEIEGLWASPRRSSLQERASAGVQAKVAGVPWRTNMEIFLEMTPAQIAAAEQQRLDDAFMNQLLGQTEATSIPGMTDPPRTTTDLAKTTDAAPLAGRALQ